MENSQVSFSEWMSNFMSEIEVLPTTIEKGDAFVSKILQIYYNLSAEDAVNATECAGPGDRGIDAIHIIEADEPTGTPQAIIVQGKYKTAGDNLQVYQESQKLFDAIKEAQAGQAVTEAVEQAASVLQNGGQVRYLIATVKPLDQAQRKDLDNVKKLALNDFGDRIVIEALSLEDIYNSLDVEQDSSPNQVELVCQVVAVPPTTPALEPNAYVGATTLADMYIMMRNYASLRNDLVDPIYDRNIRKYLKKKVGSINDGIHKTIKEAPANFIAYNNGVTIVCDAVQRNSTGLVLQNPFIVNGCQTTRTLYDYMSIAFAGIPLNDPANKMATYKNSYLAIKVLAVSGTQAERDAYTNNITRFSNKQNAVGGKDFIALEDMYKRLKDALQAEGYFLETQTGEYDTLSKSRQAKFPKGTKLINSFEATLAYAAGVLGKPHIAFGHSGYFTPGNKEYDAIANDLSADDLLIPWLISSEAVKLGYTKSARYNAEPGSEHRIQTRYFYLYLFFQLIAQIFNVSNLGQERTLMYSKLKPIIRDYQLSLNQRTHPLKTLLNLSDQAVATYMGIALMDNRFKDRNSFLKRDELIDTNQVIMAITAAKLQLPMIKREIEELKTNN